MANPFLMGELDTGETQLSSNNGANFNPFLSGTMDFSASQVENPFMSSLNNSSANTNPFAFSAEDSTSAATNFFSSPASEIESQPSIQSYENIFSAPINGHASNNAVNDFFGSFVETTQPQQAPPAPSYSSARSSIDHTPSLIDNSVNLFGSDPLDMTTSREGSGANTPKGAAPPRRPPPPGVPPRPGLPPSKETKDLILSVTGAMEATSSHLLDRLQATRTPSPTPIRDLNSPSPTPDMFGDLLGVDDVPKLPQEQTAQDVNFLGELDDFIPSNIPFQSAQMAPIAPVPTSSPSIIPVVPIPQTTVLPQPPTTAVPPPRPVPPRPPERPKAPPQIAPAQDNIIDFSEPEPVRVPPPVQNHDALSSVTITYNEPQATEDIFEVEPTPGTLSNRPSEPELDFSIVCPTSVDITNSMTTNVSGNKTANDFEASATTGSSALESQATDTAASNSLSNFASDVTETVISNVVPEPGFTTSVFDTAQPDSGFPASPFDQQNNFNGDTSLAMGFDSEMNVSVIEASTAVTNSFVDNSVFGEPTNETDNLFFNNTDTSLPQGTDLFAPAEPVLHTTPVVPSQPFNIFGGSEDKGAKVDDFDAFTAKFESVGFDDNKNVAADPFDPFNSSPFGAPTTEGDSAVGFGTEDSFDTFLATREPPPPPQSTPARLGRTESADSDDKDNDFSIFIKPQQAGDLGTSPMGGVAPALAPPPKSPVNAFQDTSPRFNPFDKSQEVPAQLTDNIFAQAVLPSDGEKTLERTDSQETPPTPLFDEDVSQPLEPFPRLNYVGSGWDMQLRQPNKKKITGQRFWKKVFIKLVYQGENPVLQLFNNKDDKDPFQELPLQPCYSVSDIGAQQYDQYGKIFTVKLQFIFYKERPGVRPGQVTKAERITNKLSQFAAYAIQGDYQGVKEFGSDLKKLGLPVEHAPQISQLFKIGSQNYEDMKQLSVCVEEALFRLAAHRDRALHYKMEEVQITAVDELYVDQNSSGGVIRQIARVRLFFLGFLSGMPDVELGVNDLVRQGKEVVGRHDIIPVVTEEWIRLEAVEFHSCVQQDEYERTRTIKFKPPDACYIELMRFRVRPPRNRELPLQLRTTICITGNKVDLKADVLVPGFSSRKLGQIPCEDVVIRFPIPECWIYLFRVEKHFRYGSVKSAHRRTGKVKGLERFLGAVDNLEPQLMEVTSGQAKYEHQHRAIVWRMPRLPKEGQGAYTTHNMVCHMALTSYDQIPEELERYCYVEFTMPVTQVSHTTVRSVSICNSDSDVPPEKYVRQLARHEYKVEIEFTQGEGPGDYIAATAKAPAPVPAPIPEEPRAPPPAPDSDSDSSS